MTHSQQDRLQFFIFSSDKPVGKGVGDKVRYPSDYKSLNDIRDWRRVLSHRWTCRRHPFLYKGFYFISCEHAFQGIKFIRTGHLEIGMRFSSNDPESVLARSDAHFAYRERRMVNLTGKEASEWDKVKSKVKDEIVSAKFSQIEVAKKVLIATENAQLWHQDGRVNGRRCYRLEQIRESLSNTVDCISDTNENTLEYDDNSL